MTRIIDAISPYCTYILEPSWMLLRRLKLIYADASAPKLDMRTRKAADVPLLAWLT